MRWRLERVGLVVMTGCSLVVDTAGLSGGVGSPGDAGIVDAGARAEGGEAGADAGGGGCTPPNEPDLVGYYPLDESAGSTARDCSGKGHDGKVVSTPGSGAWTTGKRGGAFAGDGSSGCIDLGAPADFALEDVAFTVAAWVYVNVFTNKMFDARYLIGRARDVNVAGWRLAADLNAVFAFSAVPNGTRINVESPMNQPTRAWRHVATTFEPGGQTRLYVDAAVVAQRASGGALSPAVDVTLRIGCRGDDNLYLDGRIDEVRIYRRALTLPEIQALAK